MTIVMLERFSAEAMATAFEDVYRRVAKVVPSARPERKPASARVGTLHRSVV